MKEESTGKRREISEISELPAGETDVTAKAGETAMLVQAEEAAESLCRADDSAQDALCPCCHSAKTKNRSSKEVTALIHRLNRIEGQIRGIKGMVEKNAYCTDILMQVAAATAALNSFNKALLAEHIKTCVTRDILEGKEDTVDELVATLQKLMR